MARIPSIAVVGSGSWAQRHMATIVAEEGMTFAGVVSRSLSEEPRMLLSDIASPKIWPSLDALLESGAELDGVALVVEPARIADLSYRCIDAGLPVLAEKPLSFSSRETNSIRQRAVSRNCPFFVNLIHLYSAGYVELSRRIDEIGPLEHIEAIGGNVGPFRRYMSGMWDYGPHDLSMVLDIAGEAPESIEATRLNGDGVVHTIRVEMSFGSGISAKLTFGNLMTMKQRRFRCVGSGGTLELDDHPKPKLLMNDAEIAIEGIRPLASAYRAFVRSFDTKKDPANSLELACRVNAILERLGQDLY